jgi:hypothetical protein
MAFFLSLIYTEHEVLHIYGEKEREGLKIKKFP